jgi:hypothetical protein
MEWTDVEDRIAEDDRNKWDRKAPATALRVFDDGALELNGDGRSERFALAELAASQMCQRLGIPVLYYRRLPHALQAALANHDFGRLKDNAYLLRGKDEWVRAFLSTDYVAYNNLHVADTVKSLLEGANISVKSFVLEETHLYLKVISDDIVDRDSGLKAGVMIGNSEVGLGSVSVEPFVYRLACTNDLVVSKEQSFRHPHTRLSLDELRKGTALAISIAFKVAASVLDAFLKAREEPVADPVETIRQLAEARKLSRKFADEVVSSYAAEPEPNRFGVINAFTRAAQKLGPLQRIEVERFAGTLIDGTLPTAQAARQEGGEHASHGGDPVQSMGRVSGGVEV